MTKYKNTIQEKGLMEATKKVNNKNKQKYK